MRTASSHNIFPGQIYVPTRRWKYVHFSVRIGGGRAVQALDRTSPIGTPVSCRSKGKKPKNTWTGTLMMFNRILITPTTKISTCAVGGRGRETRNNMLSAAPVGFRGETRPTDRLAGRRWVRARLIITVVRYRVSRPYLVGGHARVGESTDSTACRPRNRPTPNMCRAHDQRRTSENAGRSGGGTRHVHVIKLTRITTGTRSTVHPAGVQSRHRRRRRHRRRP